MQFLISYDYVLELGTIQIWPIIVEVNFEPFSKIYEFCIILYYTLIPHRNSKFISDLLIKLLWWEYVIFEWFLAFLLDSGISMIEAVKEKMKLLCEREGLEFNPDNNSASMIERFSVATNSLLITGMNLFATRLTCWTNPDLKKGQLRSTF